MRRGQHTSSQEGLVSSTVLLAGGSGATQAAAHLPTESPMQPASAPAVFPAGSTESIVWVWVTTAKSWVFCLLQRLFTKTLPGNFPSQVPFLLRKLNLWQIHIVYIWQVLYQGTVLKQDHRAFAHSLPYTSLPWLAPISPLATSWNATSSQSPPLISSKSGLDVIHCHTSLYCELFKC